MNPAMISNRITTALVSLLVLALLGGGYVRAEVIISEIMFNPNGTDIGSGFNKEWVEIYNTGASIVDLSGWTFEDIQDGQAALPIPGGTFLDPGEALVLTPDFVTFDTRWDTRARRINRIQLGNFPTLANNPSPTNEILAIKDSFGAIQDIVNYDNDGDWPYHVVDGPSTTLLPGFLNSSSNNSGTSWASSIPGISGTFRSPVDHDAMASPGVVATTPPSFPTFTPDPNAAWSMVVLGDTQMYAASSINMPLFYDMTEWIRDNRAAFNIQLVLQEGDIVNRNNDETPPNGEDPATQQWQQARAAMSVLDGEVPYIMSAGNHDYDGIDASAGITTRLNEFFSPSDNPLVDPAQGGILKGLQEPGHLENAYFEMTAPDGRDLLIFSLGWDPQPSQIAWANQIAGQSKYDDVTAILLTHNYLSRFATRNEHGEVLWDGLVNQNGNFEMTFNGHIAGLGAAYLKSTTNEGNDVNQMLFNTQFEGNGGNGWIRVLEFLNDGKTVRVRTYSPTFGYLREDPLNEFTFEISQLLSPGLVGDYNGDGIVDAADYTVWRDTLFSNVTPGTGADGNADGFVDTDDYTLWVNNFGTTSASSAVPEPGSGLLLLAGVLAIYFHGSPRVRFIQAVRT